MTEKQSFENFGTIAFGNKFIEKLTGFGEPIFDGIEFRGFDIHLKTIQFNFDIWLAFVPKVYQDIAFLALEEVTNSFMLGRMKVCKESKDELICGLERVLQDYIERRVLVRK